jgi:hypothetical protein
MGQVATSRLSTNGHPSVPLCYLSEGTQALAHALTSSNIAKQSW